MFLNLQHPNIRYIAPPAEGGSDTPDATPPAEPNGNGEETDWEAKYKEALGHSRDWEKKAKANKAAADELEKLKESQMSEADKAAKRTQELEAQVAAYKAKEQQAEWKAQVSAKTGIPAEALRGSTLEEIQAHADILKPLVHPAPKLPNVPNPAQHPEGKPPTNAPRHTCAASSATKTNRHQPSERNQPWHSTPARCCSPRK